jgi:hypothetical protein
LKRLAKRFRLFGGKRRGTVSTCFSNGFDVHSHKPHSILTSFTRYSEAKFIDYPKKTGTESKILESPMITVFRKENETKRS